MFRGMMRDWVGLALTVASLGACGFRSTPQAIDDGRPAEDAADGGGIVARVDAAIDGPSDDGDGVAAADDNCPLTANADQHDEDGDGVGDVCDLCPQVARSTTDEDGDGVGDACDPHPTVIGDVLVRFDPFTGSGNLPPGWQSRGAGRPEDWVRGDDVLRLVANDETRVATFDAGAPRHAIDVGVTVTAISGGQSFLTALADTRSDIRQFFGCGMRFDNMMGGKSRELFMFNADTTPQFTAIKTDTSEPPAAGVYRLAFWMEAGQAICLIPQGTNMHLQADVVVPFGNSFIGLRARNLTLELRYVAVYKF